MEFSEVLKERHSTRRFSSRPLDRSILEEMLGEAALAPSSKNSRSSSFLIVDDPQMLERISLMRDYGSALISGAAAAIIVLGDTTKTDLWIENASISTTYLLLSATSRGIGSCWVHVNGRPRLRQDPSQGTAEEYLRTLLDIPPQLRPLSVVALGYPEEQ